MTPRDFGMTPRTFGKTPQVFGETPRASGMAPRTFRKTPQVFGKTPRTSGKTPRIFGKTPRIFWMSPRAFGRGFPRSAVKVRSCRPPASRPGTPGSSWAITAWASATPSGFGTVGPANPGLAPRATCRRPLRGFQKEACSQFRRWAMQADVSRSRQPKLERRSEWQEIPESAAPEADQGRA